MHGFAVWLQGTALSNTIKSVSWVVPLLQSIHIVTIGVVFVSSLMIALRVLGLMRADDTFAAVWRRFAPWLWTGLIVMATTGLILIVAEPIREFSTLSFWMKMTLVATGAASTALFGRSLRSDARIAPLRFSVGARAGSILIVILWLAVIFLGRAIAYDKEVWGALSLHS